MTITLAAVAALLLAVSPALCAPRAPTIFPEAAQPGEWLRFVVSGTVYSAPSFRSTVRESREAGTRMVALAEVEGDGVLWVQLSRVAFVPAAFLDRMPTDTGGDLPVGKEGMIAGRVLPPTYEPTDLVPLADSLKVAGTEKRKLHLRRGAAEAFTRMIAAADKDGIVIRIFSAWRGARHQASLYAAGLRRDPAQRSVAAPGRSEHHLGTTVDVATPGIPVLTDTLADAPAGRWIEAHAAEYGIVVSFSRERSAQRGMAFEPWHLRWIGNETVEDLW
ncbi:MAG: M15 family metallopeptidase [Gemmatimonadota bacterium]|jgi:hypothetical protein|nr:hypothetical protein [Gemmatimonadota bacterium]MDP6528191.1 M15 family metallopeptidase [Gemmatimonadota bacterium]MDP6802010.1 M15 family metallopeptidase [Gemmatimonadota bacterium]MDP7031358.1 M15 family metallopeptidase [Gemmatimonadota bacterium]